MSVRGSVQSLSVILFIVGLVVGAGGGYAYVSSIYQPQLDDYEDELLNVNSRILTLESEKLELESQITSLENEKSTYQEEKIYLQEQLDEVESTITTYEITIASQENQISELQSQSSSCSSTIASMQSEISELESYIEDVGQIVVTQHYEWEFGMGYWTSDWFWDLPISIETYTEYYFRSRPSDWEDWVTMATDPYDDFYITSMVQKINEAAIDEGFTELEKVNFVISFVQSLPYTEDDVTTGWNEYPRYPIETLFDRGGDCEDTSILVAALLDRMGYDVCLLILEDAEHCAVGICIEAYGSYYEYEGKQYFYLETTGDGWEIGDFPSSITESSAYVYPLNP